ncbi:hypothetical protein JI742_09815 [Piscinibacter sp. Jin2]|uniref:Uncharacterized protein n=1 Tax=Aquariibacter lacus TaxID=2801332 RepID=A0A9X0XIP7_9BURK|nr:hypothetical protein [Piscinibacter lacus]MBL0720185.1 hypothetical protein [Piscinibacter lacus]
MSTGLHPTGLQATGLGLALVVSTAPATPGTFYVMDQFTTRPDPRNLDAFANDAAQMARELPRFIDQTNAALAALQAQFLTGVSTSSVSIGTGNRTFASQGGRAWPVGQWLVATALAAPANFMVGQVVSYNSSTGLLVLNVQQVAGSGTHASWGLSMAVAPATGLDAGNITTGVLPNARLQGSYTQLTGVTGSGRAKFAGFDAEAEAPELTLHETDQAGTAGLWRVLLEGNALRIQRSSNGTDFVAPATPLTVGADGVLTGNGAGLSNVTALRLAGSLGDAPAYAARAMAVVNISGVTPALHGSSRNVFSVTRVSAGVYDVLWSVPMPFERYALALACNRGDSNNDWIINVAGSTAGPTMTASSVRVVIQHGQSVDDPTWFSVSAIV